MRKSKRSCRCYGGNAITSNIGLVLCVTPVLPLQVPSVTGVPLPEISQEFPLQKILAELIPVTVTGFYGYVRFTVTDTVTVTATVTVTDTVTVIVLYSFVRAVL